MEFFWLIYPKATFVTPSRFLASTSPRCGSCARLLRSLRDTASCDFASQSSSRCSSGNLTPLVQEYLPPSFALQRMCPASSKRVGFKCFRWLKISRQNLTSQTIIKRRIYPIYLSLLCLCFTDGKLGESSLCSRVSNYLWRNHRLASTIGFRLQRMRWTISAAG